MTTPVRIWAPAYSNANFPWLKSFPIDEVFVQQPDCRWWCKCCEDFLTDYGPDWPVLTDHARHHKFEYREWKAEQRAQQELIV